MDSGVVSFVRQYGERDLCHSPRQQSHTIRSLPRLLGIHSTKRQGVVFQLRLRAAAVVEELQNSLYMND